MNGDWLIVALGIAVFTLGVLRLSFAIRLRSATRSAGGGLTDEESGLLTTRASSIYLPLDIETAKELASSICVAVFRIRGTQADTWGPIVSSCVRTHEFGYRIDYDVCAVVLLVKNRNEAVQAVRRLGDRLSQALGDARLEAGVATHPLDGENLYDLGRAARSRLHPLAMFVELDNELRDAIRNEPDVPEPASVR